MNYQGTFATGIARRPARRRKVEIYGRRDTTCSTCKKLFRREDVGENKMCQWCAWTGEEQAKESEVR